METFTTMYDEKIRPLMDKIDQARALLAPGNYGINFPNVIVVGDQSSGKSSLLESLSLVELPKGNGIVTRCPLVLRLRKSNERRVYRLNGDEKVLLDEGKLNVSQYIEEETNKLAGTHKNVVQDMIELQVEDPNVRDLTVVDLPGIAHNPIADQPEDIYDQTIRLIHQFIDQEGSVILCVFPANVDIATVQSFKLARKVDPSGKRTIGVITKSDLAPDQDMLVQQLLMDRPDVLYLKLGFVAVRNRSSKENISLQEAHEREKEFFNQHPASTAAGWDLVGINSLINRLATVYSDRVKETFPKLRKDIQRRLEDVKEQLSKLPPDLQTNTERLAVYNETVDLYVDKILKASLVSSNDPRHSTIVNVLHKRFESFRQTLRQQRADLFSTAYCSKVEEEMRACAGQQLPNFLCSSILKKCICEKLNQLWTETELLINSCFSTTMTQLRKAEDDGCKNNPLLSKLISLFRNVSIGYIKEKKDMVRNQLKELVELDANEPYTINTSYMYIFEKYKGPMPQQNNIFTTVSTPTARAEDYDDDTDVLTFKQDSSDAQAVRQMLLSIYSYWKLLTKRFIDYATLSLRAALLFTICPVIQQRLRRIPVEYPDRVEKYLADDEFIRNRRKQCEKTKVTLEKIYRILDEHSTRVHDDMDSYSADIESDSAVNSKNVVDSGTTKRSFDVSPAIPRSSSEFNQSSPQSIQPNLPLLGASTLQAPSMFGASSSGLCFGTSASSTTNSFTIPTVKKK